jgi:hypothetical protein
MSYSGDKLTGEVEIDETFVGGKNKNRHWNKRLPISRGRSMSDKIAVMGIQRDGKVVCEVTVNTRTKSLTKPILENVDKSATIYVDEWKGYNQVKKTYKNGVVNHSKGKWAIGDACTNGIESFWGQCKRSINGSYVNITGAHMHRYFNEFAFRHNTRNVSDYERFELFFDNIEHTITQDAIRKEFKERNRRNLSELSEEQWAFWREREKKRKQKEKESKKILTGQFGKTIKPFNKEVQKKCVGDAKVITCRPADLIEPQLPKFEAECAKWKQQDEDVLSYALFPEVATEFFKYRQAQQEKVDVASADNKNKAYPV